MIAGKTVLLKKKAIKTKEELMAEGKSEDVYFISLTSCNERGIPIHPTALFDMFSKRQMLKHNVIGMTMQDLYNEYKNSNVVVDESKDLFQTSFNISQDQKLRKAFEDTSEKYISGKMKIEECMKVFQQNGFNGMNALQVLVERKINSTTNEYSRVDVYNLLYSFVNQRRQEKKPFHIFVDEYPLLQSSSKHLFQLYFNYISYINVALEQLCVY